jgi:hypothetical protein
MAGCSIPLSALFFTNVPNEVSKKLVSRALVTIIAAIPSQEFARRIPNGGFQQVSKAKHLVQEERSRSDHRHSAVHNNTS